MANPQDSQKPDLGSLRIRDDQRAKSATRKRIVYATIPVILFGAIVAAAYALRNQKPVVTVATVAQPDSGAAQTALNASGYITPRQRATIAAKITGRVTAVFFDEGTRVKEGQLLATLDDADYKRALDSTKADRDSARAAIKDFEVQLKNAEIELTRATQLHDKGIGTQEALDNAGAAADSLRAKIELAKQQVAASESRIAEAQQAVDNCTISAPFAGVVVSKDAQVGEMVSPNSAGGGFTRTGIATIVDMKSNEIEVDVNESYIAKVREGQAVKATLDAFPDAPYEAKVRTVIPTADRQKATVKVRITILKLDEKILPDMGVKVAFLEEPKPIPIRKGADKIPEAAGYIPKSAVRSDSNASYVFLIKDGAVERRAVTVGADRGADVAVLAGLAPGDSIVVNILKGSSNLRDGDKVEVGQ
ncbi:MAG TPA: efflux RND transporter periplasmic adaptor subunit [Candidatus Cybelea sp.]|jgi:RND family efflux transporter MFP subunit|nr:efflux RND transporter periplasmic adaptor subunit [Candidatus Cybelea sp.]